MIKRFSPDPRGGPLMHTIAAKAVCLGEALKARVQGVRQKSGCQLRRFGPRPAGSRLAAGFRRNGQPPDLVDLRDRDITGKELERRLDEVYITVNKNSVPNEPRSPFVTSGIRIGTAAVTTRGLDEADMEKIAEYIALAVNDFEKQRRSHPRRRKRDLCPPSSL